MTVNELTVYLNSLPHDAEVRVSYVEEVEESCGCVREYDVDFPIAKGLYFPDENVVLLREATQ